MPRFRIATIPHALVEQARGQSTAHAVTADHQPGFPCRVCMDDAQVGERMLLVPFAPLPPEAPNASTGPVYLHARDCRPYREDDGIPPVLRRRVLSLRGYDTDGRMRAADLVDGAALEDAAAALLDRAGIDHVDVHFAKPGCYACRIDRA